MLRRTICLVTVNPKRQNISGRSGNPSGTKSPNRIIWITSPVYLINCGTSYEVPPIKWIDPIHPFILYEINLLGISSFYSFLGLLIILSPAREGTFRTPSTSSKSNHHLFLSFGFPYPIKLSAQMIDLLAIEIFLTVQFTNR